jgi:hypothetical protein
MPATLRHLRTALPLLLAGGWAAADIDRVYHPYVDPLETEIEWRAVIAENDGDADRERQLHRLAIGRALAERLFVEGYLIGEKDSGESLSLSGYEVEALYQLSEPGEYWADWAAIVEIERDIERNIWEVGAGVVLEKEFGTTSVALNLISKYEFGRGIDNELELEGALQWRWRWRESFEPAIEYYVGDGTHGLGPVLTGTNRFGARKLKWELGVIFGISNDTPEHTLRTLVEFEF